MPELADYTDDLIGWWAERASLPMYDDGVIYYKAPKSHYRKVFKKLERKTGLNFKRVKKIDNAEMICEIENIDDGANGYAYFNTKFKNKWYLTVDGKSRYYRKTMAHEIGHALGLDHPDHSRTDTIMSYGSDRWKRENEFFRDVDIAAISQIFPVNDLT